MFEMDKKALLEQFEALPLMVAILNDSFIYVDQTNEYAHHNLEDNRVTLGYVNGAWYAFQHQQAKVEELEGKLKQAYEDVDTFAEAHERECGFKAQLAKDKAGLQKRVDQQGLIIAKAMSIASDLQKSWSMFEIGKKLEQALKGEG